MPFFSSLLLLVVMITLGCISPGLAQPGIVATSFSPGSATDHSIYALSRQKDGKIVIGGEFTVAFDGVRGRIARLDVDGTIDRTFGAGLPGADGAVRCVAVQEDGKVVIGGEFTAVNGIPRARLARLNPNGSLDESFGNSAWIPGGTVHALCVQSDGKVLVGGSFEYIWNQRRNGIAQIHSDGTLDSAFGSPFEQYSDSAVAALAVQPDGKVVVGRFSRGGVTRLNSDGSVDSEFETAHGAIDGAVMAIALQADGKILIGGTFRMLNESPHENLLRLHEDGSIDLSFTCKVAVPGISSIAVLSNDHIMIPNALLDSSGMLLPWPGGNSGANDAVHAITAYSSKVLMAGSFTAFGGVERNRIAQVNEDGSLDLSFDQLPSGPNGSIHALISQRDGQFLVGGNFTMINGEQQSGVARLCSDGTVDRNFRSGLSGGGVRAMVQQADGKIIVGGSEYWYSDGSMRYYVARLNRDGALDLSFGTNTRVITQTAHCLALQNDGKVIVGTLGWPGIFRLNPDGSADGTFTETISGEVFSVALQSDGQIVLGGSFTEYSPWRQYYLIRLDTSGHKDPSFQAGQLGPNGPVRAVAVQADGRILIAGEFYTVNGIQCLSIARLNPDGSVDGSFRGEFSNEIPFSLCIQRNGGILVAGRMRNGVARLLSDGSLDRGFTPGVFLSSGFNCDVLGVAEDLLGGVMVGGNFTSIGGIARRYVARLWGDQPYLIITRSREAVTLTWPTVWTGFLPEHTSAQGNVWSNLVTTPRNDGTNWFVNLAHPNDAGFYRLKK